MAGCNIDCHALIIDQRPFPVPPGRGYKPKPDESGTRGELAATLDAHGIARFPCGELRVMGARPTPTFDDVHGGETAAMTFLETSRGVPVEVSGTMAGPGYPPCARDQLEIFSTQACATFADNELRRLGPNPRVQAFDGAAGYHESFDGVIAHFVDCLEIGAVFEMGPADKLETLRLVEHAYWSAGPHRLSGNNSERGP